MEFPEFVIALAAIFCLFGWPMVWIVAHACQQSIKSWSECRLKQAMVERGYTAQEIVQVVAATKGSRPQIVTDVPPAKPVRQPAFGQV